MGAIRSMTDEATLFKDSIGVLGYLLLGIYVLRTYDEYQ